MYDLHLILVLVSFLDKANVVIEKTQKIPKLNLSPWRMTMPAPKAAP